MRRSYFSGSLETGYQRDHISIGAMHTLGGAGSLNGLNGSASHGVNVAKAGSTTDVCKLVGLSRSSSFYSRVGEGSFPALVKLSDHCVRWRREDLEAWIGNPKPRS